MKKSVLTLVNELKEVLEGTETIVFEIKRPGKPTFKFTINKDEVKSVCYKTRRTYND